MSVRTRLTDPAQEHAFREWDWSDHRFRARVGLGFCSALLILLGIADYLFLGWSASFLLCQLGRWSCGAWGFAIVRAMGRCGFDLRFDRRILAWTLCAGGVVVAITSTRPAGYFFSVVLNLTSALAIYLFIPNRFRYTLAAGAAYSAVYLAAFLAARPPLHEGLVFTLSLLFINAINIINTHSQTQLRRLDYLRLRAEEAARDRLATALREKTLLMGTISHEVRTPLHGLMTCAQLLSSTALSPEQRELLALMHYSGKTMIQLIDDLLELACAEASTLRIVAADFSPRRLVEELAAFARPRVEQRGLLLSVAIAPDVPEALHGDAGRLRQVLLNFVENAVKFCDHGAIAISVAAVEQSASAVRVRFEVTDDGPGVPETAREAIFEPFVQATQPRGPSTGTGLGLAICKRLVEAMGGSVGVGDARGGGACFHFSLPLAIAHAAPPLEPARPAPALATLSPLSLLVVEDDEVSRKLAAVLFDRCGHRVTLASTGREAVDTACARSFDAVLMDLRLPGFDGCEATRRIRAQRDPVRASTPIIAITANALPGDRARCEAAGITRFVSKPIVIEDLLAVLAEVTAGRTPASDDSPLVDEAALASHARSLGQEEVDALLALFVRSSRVSLTTLLAAVERGAGDEVALRAHQLASACRSTGLVRCAEAAAQLERIARAAPDQIPCATGRLVDAHAASVETVLRRLGDRAVGASLSSH